MEFWTVLILIFVLWSLLEQVMGRSRRGSDSEPPGDGGEAGGAEPLRRVDGAETPQTVEEWISEELGINLERRPRVRVPRERRPRPPGGQRPERTGPREVRLPRPGERAGTPRLPRREPDSLEEEPQIVSLEEIGAGERGAPVSLERPRTPADHDRFHERYEVPKPVATHQEFHRRYVSSATGDPRVARRPGARLPKLRHASDLQRMVVWSEILRRPPGLGPL